MTTNPATDRTPMTATRKAALIAGLAYIATFLFSIPVKFGLWKDVLDEPNWILGAGSEAGVPLGAMFEVLTALTGVVTAVAVYSVLQRKSQGAALGFVTSRVAEAVTIVIGVIAVMSMFTLRNDVAGTAGADASSLLTTGSTLVAVHDWAFLLGPGLMAVVNACCFASVLHRFRLVPRLIPTIGLIGAPLLLISDLGTLFGAWDQLSVIGGLLVLPIATWELSVGTYMLTKGFRTGESFGAPKAEADELVLEPLAA